MCGISREKNRELKEKGIMNIIGKRHIWLYTSENLPERYRETYNELKKADLLTGKAYSMKENIRNLWNLPTPDKGRKYWDSWYSWVVHSSVGCNEGCCKDDESPSCQHTELFHSPYERCNGRGINTIIAQMENMTFRYRNMEHLNNANILRMAI